MTLSYDEIYSYFLGYINDPRLASLDIKDAYGLMQEYLHKTTFKPFVRRLFSSITLDDEIEIVYFKMAYEVDEESDKEFICDILAKGMVLEWLQPKYRSMTNIGQFFGGSEQKFYSQSNHISEIREMVENTDLDIRNLIKDRGYIYNSYLEET